jgi:hypothetical protein
MTRELIWLDAQLTELEDMRGELEARIKDGQISKSDEMFIVVYTENARRIYVMLDGYCQSVIEHRRIEKQGPAINKKRATNLQLVTPDYDPNPPTQAA